MHSSRQLNCWSMTSCARETLTTSHPVLAPMLGRQQRAKFAGSVGSERPCEQVRAYIGRLHRVTDDPVLATRTGACPRLAGRRDAWLTARPIAAASPAVALMGFASRLRPLSWLYRHGALSRPTRSARQLCASAAVHSSPGDGTAVS